MDIHALLEKLDPLMPEQTRHWRRTLPLVDEESKYLLHKHIVSVAQRHLGEYDRRLLLSLPPRSRSGGDIMFGRVVYDMERWPFSITKKEMLQNLAIFGRSGAGKTNAAFQILTQLDGLNVPVLFLDWKRTGRHLMPYLKRKVRLYTPGRNVAPFTFNPLIPPPGLEPRLYGNLLIDVMASAFTLGDGSKSILQNALAACYDSNDAPTLSEVVAYVEALDLKSRAQGWKVSAIRALQSLSAFSHAPADRSRQKMVVQDLTAHHTILELDGLNEGEKKFLIPLLCLWVYYVKLASAEREELKLVILVEEAHHVLHRQAGRTKEGVMEMLLRQCREIGIGMMVVDQHPHLISSAALGNTYTSICLNLKDPSDINKAAAVSLVDDRDKRWFSMLPVGHGVVKLQDRWSRPFLVKFPLLPFAKGSVSDEALHALSRQDSALSVPNRPFIRPMQGLGGSRDADVALGDQGVAFLSDITVYPDDGVDSRYRRLGLSSYSGNRIKVALVESGLVEEASVRIGRTHRTILRLSTLGKELFGIPNNSRASLAHEYWKRFYGEKLKAAGFTVTLEAPRESGEMDILATRASESLAIEVETGKSDVVRNVRQDLSSGITRVLVVATDEHALRTVERQLAQAGLLIPSRVMVVLRDRFPDS